MVFPLVASATVHTNSVCPCFSLYIIRYDDMIQLRGIEQLWHSTGVDFIWEAEDADVKATPYTLEASIGKCSDSYFYGCIFSI